MYVTFHASLIMYKNPRRERICVLIHIFEYHVYHSRSLFSLISVMSAIKDKKGLYQGDTLFRKFYFSIIKNKTLLHI